MITFVIFHIEINKADGGRGIPQQCAPDREYLQLIRLAFASASQLHPGCRKVILTDEITDFTGLDDDIAVHRFSIDPKELMFQRIRVQYEFLKGHDFLTHVAFVDSDMLFVHDLMDFFNVPFDVGLTYRKHDTMPINGGLILVRKKNQENVLDFFNKFYCTTRDNYSHTYGWNCDQYALLQIIGNENYTARKGHLLTVGKTIIALWPCDTHNFSPENNFHTILSPFRDKVILHFKGDRKRLMPYYWHAHLSKRNGEIVFPRIARLLWRMAIVKNMAGESLKWRFSKPYEN